MPSTLLIAVGLLAASAAPNQVHAQTVARGAHRPAAIRQVQVTQPEAGESESAVTGPSTSPEYITMPADDGVAEMGSLPGCCDQCGSRGCKHGRCGAAGVDCNCPGYPGFGAGGCNRCNELGPDGLPCVFRGTCNLFPHTPYYVEPKTYHYFRPYNHNHVWLQSERVERWGGDRRHPYANEIFAELYRQQDEPVPAVPVPAAPGAVPPAGPNAPRPGDARPQDLGEQDAAAPIEARLVRFLDQTLRR